MIRIIRIGCIALVTTLLLSITINQKPVFNYIYGWISPLTNPTQSLVQRLFQNSLESTKEYTKSIFENSVPKIKDTVKSKMSSTRKLVHEPEEKITPEEKEQLDELIKSHR